MNLRQKKAKNVDVMQVPASEMWRLTALSCDPSLWVLNVAQTKDVNSRSHFDIFCVIVIRKHYHWENNIIPTDDETHCDWLITSYTRLVVINAPSVISLTDTAVTVYVPVFDRLRFYTAAAVKLHLGFLVAAEESISIQHGHVLHD